MIINSSVVDALFLPNSPGRKLQAIRGSRYPFIYTTDDKKAVGLTIQLRKNTCEKERKYYPLNRMNPDPIFQAVPVPKRKREGRKTSLECPIDLSTWMSLRGHV